MATNQPAADGSDIITVQGPSNTDQGSETVVLRGYPIDIGAELQNFKATDTVVGYFSGNH